MSGPTEIDIGNSRTIAVGFRRIHFLNIALAASVGQSLDEACQIAEDAHRSRRRAPPPRPSGHRRLRMANTVDHPAHYGGADNPYETIKVLEAWMTPEQMIGFYRGNALKYLSRAGKKGDALEDLKKARWYLDREIQAVEKAHE